MPTVLFTDIESSTRLWEEHPVAMAEALARHDAILSKAVTDAGGTVVKTTGDGFVAVFETTWSTVGSVIAAQTALNAEDWGEVGAVRVRMGVHRGETQTRDGDHYGRDMNRAARVMAAAHGGQVLLSQSAASDATGRLPDHVTLRDLGVHRLKDLTQPEHLFQLVAPGLANDFAPPLTLNSRPHNLPLQATEFHGRRDELDAIAVLLASPQTRLLTITGPGGAGKTRLGLQVAAEHVNDFADGVFFVDLSSERDPDSAMEEIVRALDLPGGSGDDALGTLQSRLRDR
ncbi:MAG TPA: adenylate/guanylate cyclase domain-containing protein, partial [Acidimicrobiia bacterium]